METIVGQQFGLRITSICKWHSKLVGQPYVWRVGEGVAFVFFFFFPLRVHSGSCPPEPQVSWPNIKEEPGRGDDKLQRQRGGARPCYHPIPNLSVLVSDVSLTHSSFSLRLAERVRLCLSIHRPLGTVQLGCVLISGTPLWTGKFPGFYPPHLICSYWI